MKQKTMLIVYVEWIDAHSNSDWMNENGIDKFSVGDWWCSSVGFLLRRTKKEITIALRYEPKCDIHDEEQWGCLQRIPTTWIRKWRVLGRMRREPRGFIERKGT
jgi:hypothetical protein